MKIFYLIVFLFQIYNSVVPMRSDVFFNEPFGKIRVVPEVISFSNSHEINNNGGHLQGVQLMQHKNKEYAILTGSSDSYSYYSVVKLGAENKVISVNRLMDKPFKHAGGFQVFRNYMAIGIEDNQQKDKSKVCIYDISDPENPAVEPLAVIEREGSPFRSTAGCVGITKYKNEAFIAVGDWDTRNIDFYTSPYDELDKGKFEKRFSINGEAISKDGWVNNSWPSYQNINLFSFRNELFLIGLGHDNNGKNVADLFQVTIEVSGKVFIKKVASRIFNCKKTSFRAGAGVIQGANKIVGIVSCANHIDDISYLNIFNSFLPHE